jgi:hypothetical protein
MLSIEKLKDLHLVQGRAHWKYLDPTDKQVATIGRLAPRLDISGLDRGACMLLLSQLISNDRERWAHSFPRNDDFEG